ncbi:MAG: formate C-acetyltransferase/glycerol dehydratase family glycyl radical enzyme [Lachnospiraceae bacterium]|nr:formate C-acetyltransferase/glycerol dehydratase family glycyl radical enzyme [Lachnospiraceae bacterium]
MGFMMENEHDQVHCCAVGLEPYDQTYSLGYKVGHEDWSPYPRVNRLRKTFLDRPYNIDNERFRNVTEAYKENENCTAIIRCARAFEKILMNATLEIYDDDLILGEIAAPAKASPQYPEFSVNWMLHEVLHEPFEEREHDQYYFVSEEDRQEFIDLCQYWKGKTVEDLANASLDDEMTKGSQTGKKIFQTNLYHYGGVGHFVMDYARILREGFDGMIAKAREGLSGIDKVDPDYAEKRDFYEAVIICHEAAKKYILRYAALAEEKAAAEQDPKRKEELLMMAENSRQVAGGPAKTFWQALQLFNYATTLTLIESNGHSVSYGRMDQWLYPYYEADMKNGTISKEFAQELLEVTYVKMNNPTKVRDGGTAKVRQGRGFGGECLTIGGVDREGNDVTNDLTMMLLDASVHTRMMCPWLLVRMHENTPYEVKVKTVECIRAGYGHPKIFNDEPTIKAMMRKGMSLEEARDYAVVGCVEPNLPGKEYGWHDGSYINTVKFMEMVLNGGRCLDCGPHCVRWEKCGALGEHLGPDTGSLETYQSFDEVLESVDKQFKYWADQMCGTMNIVDKAHRARKPLPYVSAFFEDTFTSGKDISAGGAKYNGIGPQASGLATCADTLAAIKQLVFEEKRYTGAELLQAVKDNWEGHEVLYALVNSPKVHHYGNDDDYADELFKFMFECYCRNLSGRPTPRGGSFTPGVYSVSANVGMGLNTNASLDGRKAGEAISDNMGPVHTDAGAHDIYGPTALANSVAKVDHSLATNGTLLNVKFPQEAVAGVEGRDNLVSFIDEYLSKKPMHIQFNIMSSATMRAAQKKPEDYKDMLVRVAGYSAYFVELGKALQKDLIQRTELHF